MIRITLITAAACWSLGCTAAPGSTDDALDVIPRPASIQRLKGVFILGPATRIAARGAALPEALKLGEALAPALGFRLKRVDRPARTGCIELRIEPSLRGRLGEEGYELEATTRTVKIRAAAPAGLFYATQTLRQLLPPPACGQHRAEGIAWTIPCARIVDSPRFAWRGLLIDPARHFIPVPDFERYIDAMAFHKFNRLQVHFTDDQGWRIEIKKYPELVRVGSKVDFTAIRSESSAGDQKAGGFYSQADLRHLVQYAAQRYVTIVPEIEMPAHTGAAIVSYPELGLYPAKLNALPPERRWTAHEAVLAPRPGSVAFMQDVLSEVLELFPSQHIHIGGDEANIDHWRKCEEMQSLLRELKLKDETELHSWFIRQMDSFLTARGRQLVGWDEILQGGLAAGAVVMSWRGEEGGIAAARAGHDVVMAPTSHTYFDYYQGPAEKEPKAIGGLVPLEKVYRYEPIPAVLDTTQSRHLLGAQAQLWGEFIATPGHRMYMTYPRAAAMAEVVWSPRAGRDYESFLKRLRSHLQRLEAMGVNYRPL